MRVFETAEAFKADNSDIDKDVTIYIDSYLANGVCGEEIAKEIYERSFKRIILATGYPPGRFAASGWLAGVIGKDPPWG